LFGPPIPQQHHTNSIVPGRTVYCDASEMSVTYKDKAQLLHAFRSRQLPRGAIV
jgi:hypothetical protein